MDLSPEQKATLKQWAADGMTLSQIQRSIEEKFNLHPSFMDLRFLMLDLHIELKDVNTGNRRGQTLENMGAKAANEEPLEGEEADAPVADTGLVDAGSAPKGRGRVAVTVDKIAQPGAVVNGTVTFSDGTTSKWFLDQLGRLALDGPRKGYRPSQDDLMEFQRELNSQLQKRGF